MSKISITYRNRHWENVRIQGITDDKIIINKSTLISFNRYDLHRVFVDFDRFLDPDFLKNYNCVIDLKNKQLVTNFKTISLYKVTDNSNVSETVTQNVTNKLKLFKLKSTLQKT